MEPVLVSHERIPTLVLVLYQRMTTHGRCKIVSFQRVPTVDHTCTAATRNLSLTLLEASDLGAESCAVVESLEVEIQPDSEVTIERSFD